MPATVMPIAITSLYAALLGLFLIPITLRVGFQRFRTKTSLGDGGDQVLLQRIRSHANFLEYVPIALILIALAELSGAGIILLHGLGITLVLARVTHYITLNTRPLSKLRAASMMGTMAVLLVSSLFLLWQWIA